MTTCIIVDEIGTPLSGAREGTALCRAAAVAPDPIQALRAQWHNCHRSTMRLSFQESGRARTQSGAPVEQNRVDCPSNRHETCSCDNLRFSDARSFLLAHLVVTKVLAECVQIGRFRPAP
jgi:hypothetical protein